MLAGDDAAAEIRELTKGRGTDLVLDFVGVDTTIALAVAVARPLSDVTLVGIGMGSYPFSFFTVPYEVSLASTYWGSVTELMEVIALAEAGHDPGPCRAVLPRRRAQGLREDGRGHAPRPRRDRPVVDAEPTPFDAEDRRRPPAI